MNANDAKADYFVSIHRNSSPTPNQYTGVETLVYNNSGIKSQMAANINSELEKAGFKNLGITERPNLVVLKRTKMPAVLVEAGFINNDKDNETFDKNFNQIANGIADDMLSTTVMACNKPVIISPAMNTKMYNNPILQDNLDKLRRFGYEIVELRMDIWHVEQVVQERCLQKKCWLHILRE